MDRQITDKDGRAFQRLPVIDYENLTLPILEMDREAVKNLPKDTNPLALFVALLDQIGSQNNVVWAGMHALAKDIYARDPALPEGIIPPKRHFQEFAESIGLKLTDHQGSTLDVGEDLKK